MGWSPFSASDSNTSSSSNTSQYGTHTPILSPQYNSIFNAYASTLGFDPAQWAPPAVQSPQTSIAGVAPIASLGDYNAAPSNYPLSTSATYTGANPQIVSGYNPSQTTAVNFMGNNLANNPVDYWTTPINQTLGGIGMEFNKQNSGLLAGIQNQTAPQSAGTSTIDPNQAASYMQAYMSPYTDQVVDATLKNYDQNTANQLNALNASRGAGSAFGDRAYLSDGQFLNQSDLNRAQTEASLRNLGFTNALQPAMADAGNNLAAQTSNAANTLSNNQFNVNAQLQSTNQKLAAASQISQNLQAGAGLTQQVLSNIISANGVDVQAAQNLFNAGTISQAQLNALLSAAQATNGSQFTQNTNTSGNSNTFRAGI